jgi:hypothetical protein
MIVKTGKKDWDGQVPSSGRETRERMNEMSRQDTHDRISRVHGDLSMDRLADTGSRRAVLGADFVDRERVMLDSVKAWLEGSRPQQRGRHELRSDAA